MTSNVGMAAAGMAGLSDMFKKIQEDVQSWGDLDGDGEVGKRGDKKKLMDTLGVMGSKEDITAALKEMGIEMDEKTGLPKTVLTEDQKKDLESRLMDKSLETVVEQDVLKDLTLEQKQDLMSRLAKDTIKEMGLEGQKLNKEQVDKVLDTVHTQRKKPKLDFMIV